MKVRELYKQTASLGFEDSLESGSRFIFAVNRALLQVASLRPAISTCAINHLPLRNAVIRESFIPITMTDDIIFYANSNVKAYYFEADGNGQAVIERYDGEKWLTVHIIALKANRSFASYRGFIKADGEFINTDVRIRFTGEFIYSVKNVAMYSDIYSTNEDDIPAYEPFTRYDMKDIVSDFMGFADPPIKEAEGERISKGYDIEGESIIMFPYGNSGCYKVMYKHLPSMIPKDHDVEGTDDKDLDIDLDEELCSLMPILVASYIWLEDEPEMAQYYLQLYRERVMEIESKMKSHAPVVIRDVYGW